MRIPIPYTQGWSVYSRIPQGNVTGFEAIIYTNDSEIVISYAGTYNDADWGANVALGFGLETTPQLFQAAEYYMQIKLDKPDVTPTGHSLGGGLVSLIAIRLNLHY